jgi:serine/threonine-protein kinase
MDFFPGEGLKVILERETVLPPGRVIGITKQILLALGEAHKAGIIHRDLKPDNLLIETAADGTDRVRILDFGIAKMLAGEAEGEATDLTQGGVIGTPRYMSPEQATGEKIDGRSDLYAMGCILYEMLAGRPPFNEGTARSILMSHMTVVPKAFRLVRADFSAPPQLERLVLRLLEKEPEKRPPSAEAVIRLLTGEPRARGGAGEAPRRAGNRLKRLALGGALAALLAALGFYGIWREEATPSAQAKEEAAFFPREMPSEGARQGKAAPGNSSPRTLRCPVCGATYLPGEKVGDMCHGEPLLEVEK